MRVDLDANIRTADGHDAGSVQRVIVDPRTNEVTHFVVSTGGLLGRDVLVAREELDRASADGDAVQLALTKEELESLPTFMPAEYTVPPPGWVAPVGYGFGYGGFLWPTAAPCPATSAYVPTTPPPQVATPPGREDNVGIGKDAMVVDSEGEDIGVVEDVVFEPDSGHLRGFVLRFGGPVRTFFGGGEHVEVPASTVDRVSEGIVYLNAPKHSLKEALERAHRS